MSPKAVARRLRPPRIKAAVLVVAITAGGLLHTATAEELYRWTDEDGNVHYSDSLPAEKAADARDIYDRTGRLLEEVDAALSEEERELKRQRERQEERAEELRRQEQQAQAEYDRMLRRTYTSVSELEEARDERVANLRASVDLAQRRVERYQEELERLREDAARQERMADGNPEPVYERIEQLEERVTKQQDFIERRQADMEEVRTEFASHIERFRELQGADDAEDEDTG
ncbi:MAG: DUF4124 domain-containing protein [Ectothiorhodospiraceae bacterium]